MNNEEFNQLLNGPLSHPQAGFTITRLALALRAVVMATGDYGAEALREHCRQREAQDARLGQQGGE